MHTLRNAAALTLACLLGMAGCGEVPEKATVGLTAPDFTLVDLEGTTWKLSDLQGQVVLVNFWATWCPPCLEEMPSMENLYRTMPKDSFTMLAVLYKDDPAAAENLKKSRGFSFPVLVDPEERTGQAYGLTGVPETFIVDKIGVLREKFIGPVQWDGPPARQMLAKYLNQ
jgi:peroxiredoxin